MSSATLPNRAAFPGAIAAAILIFLSVFLALSPSLRGDFLWDDNYWLVDSRLTPYPDGLGRAWTEGDRYDFLPLTSSAFWMLWRTFGPEAPGYRVVSAILHGVGALLLWRVLLRLPMRGAFVAAVLFAVHPVVVGSVAWITELKNTLSGVFFFGSLLAFLRADDAPAGSTARIRGTTLSLALFVVSLLAKGSTVVLPAILLVLLAWRRGRIARDDLLRLAPFFVLAAVGALAAAHVQAERGTSGVIVRPEGMLARLAIAGGAIAFYLGKAIAPIDLSMIYPRWVVDPAHVVSWVPLAAVVLAFVGLIVAVRRSPAPGGEPGAARSALALLSAFVLALVPVLGVVDLAWFRFAFVADHWAYLAIPWAMALVADWGARAIAASPLRAGAPAFAAAAILAMGVAGFGRARAFENEGTLWPDTIAKNPGSWVAYNSYGRWQAGGGKRDEARALFEEASRIRPDYSYPVYNLALTYAEVGDFERAKELLLRAIEIAPNYPDAHASLGGILVSQGALDEGIAHLETSLRFEERNANAQVALGIALIANGEPARAVEALLRAKSLAPKNANAPYNLARALVQVGRLEEAADEMREVLRIQPNHPDARQVLDALEQAMAQSQGAAPPAPPATP